LTLEAEYGGVYPGEIQEATGVVDEVFGREIVASVDYQVVVLGENGEGVLGGEFGVVRDDIAVRIEVFDCGLR